MDIKPTHQGSCHCGAVKFEVHIPDGLVDLRYCNCSMCRRRGAVVASVPLDGFRLLAGSEYLHLYQFNTKSAKHYFCSVCGIYTHHQQRAAPDHFGFNVGCLNGIDPFTLGDVPVYDGVNHPCDHLDFK
jgi:hypothetical protein